MQKPEKTPAKKLCILTLTRIFVLADNYQSLTRVITKPSLPTFITGCLNSAKTSNPWQEPGSPSVPGPLLQVSLQAFAELITIHPTIFRPFVSQIQATICPLIAPTPSNLEPQGQRIIISDALSIDAREVFVMLSSCATKDNLTDDWMKSFQDVVLSTHSTVDRVFRVLKEDWKPPLLEKIGVSALTLNEVLSDKMPEPLAIPGWTGLYAGIERINGLLQILEAFLTSKTSSSVKMPIEILNSLVGRLLSVLQPGLLESQRLRPEISRDEREGLEVDLPGIHTSAITILSYLVSRMGSSFANMAHGTLEQVLSLLEIEKMNGKVRKAAYELVCQVLTTFGPSLSSSCAKQLSNCVKHCCEDLLPEKSATQEKNVQSSTASSRATGNQESSVNAATYLRSGVAGTRPPTGPTSVKAAAQNLLRLSLTELTPGMLSKSLRGRIDRVLILTNDGEGMLASTMSVNSLTSASSVAPFLARSHPGLAGAEAFLRPQMPMILPLESENEGYLGDTEVESELQKVDSVAEKEDSVAEKEDSVAEKSPIPLPPEPKVSGIPPLKWSGPRRPRRRRRGEFADFEVYDEEAVLEEARQRQAAIALQQAQVSRDPTPTPPLSPQVNVCVDDDSSDFEVPALEIGSDDE